MKCRDRMKAIAGIVKSDNGKTLILAGLLGCLLGCGTLEVRRGYLVESPTNIGSYSGSRPVAVEGGLDSFAALNFKMPVLLEIPVLGEETLRVLIDCDPQGEPLFCLDQDGDGTMMEGEKLPWNIEGATQVRFARVEIPAWHFKDVPAARTAGPNPCRCGSPPPCRRGW